MSHSYSFLITFGLYIVSMVAIGFLAYRFTKNLGDYILGGRSLGSFVTALSAGASDMSGWLLMGLPGAIYTDGLVASWIAIGLIIGAYWNWKLVAGRLRLYTERMGNALTLPDFFSSRFDDRRGLLRIFSAVVILFFFLIYSASGVVAGARLFESLFPVSYGTALWLGAGATILYTLVGGFLAVSWTDCVQASLMIGALLIVPVVVISHTGGPVESVSLVENAREGFSSLWNSTGVIGIISAAAWGFGYFGQPHILARFMAAKSPESIPAARRISMTWMVLCLGGAVAVGYFGVAYFLSHPGESAAAVAANPERVFIILSSILFPSWMAGVVLSAVLAAIMSTLSCQLLVCSSALTEDIYRSFLRRKAGQRELVWMGRAMVLLISVLSIWIAANPESRVLGLVAYAWAGFAAAFGPVVVIALFWRGTTLFGAISGMLSGAITVVVWGNWLAKPTGLYEIVPGVIVATLAVFGVSLLGRPSAAMISAFDTVDAEYRKRMNPRAGA